jgi:Putative addiction module component
VRRIADSLLESLDSEIDENAEEAWQLEIRNRLAGVDRGVLELIPWADARKQLEAHLQR